jgi:Ser/Thr protein kinase RdoA (MazF antagonist)
VAHAGEGDWQVKSLLPSLTVPLFEHTPQFSVREAALIAEELYGIQADIRQLPSERDQNFLLDGPSEQFVLKIANGLEDSEFFAAQVDALNHLRNRVDLCPRPILNVRERYVEHVKSSGGEAHLVRLNGYLPGIALGELATVSPELLADLGDKLGRLDKALLDFDDAAVHRNFHWDLANWQAVVTGYAYLIANAELRSAISGYLRQFEEDVAPKLSDLRKSCIHGDPNDYNILVNIERSTVSGFIDLGDMVYSYTVADLAIALAYVVLKSTTPLVTAAQVVRGYHRALPLQENEIEALWGLMLMRLCMSVCLAAYQQQQQPENAYLDISQKAIRERLPALLEINQKQVSTRLFETR